MADIHYAILIKGKDHVPKLSGRMGGDYLSLHSAFPTVALSVGDLVSKVDSNPRVFHWVKIHKTSSHSTLLSDRPHG